MPFVKPIEREEAQGELKTLYEEIIAQWNGRLPSPFKAVGLNPAALRGMKELSLAASFGGSTLGRRREEMIATAVSVWNGCHY